jgi:hypothetical protein
MSFSGDEKEERNRGNTCSKGCHPVMKHTDRGR